MMKEAVSGLFLWSAVVILVTIGVASTINRSLAVANGEMFFDPIRPYLPQNALREVEKYDHAFVNQPALTFLHIIPGSIFLFLPFLQFSSRIRNRHMRFHRWSGRLIVLIAILSVLSGLFLSVSFRFTGALASSAAVFYGILFLVALIRAFILIRRHDVVRHREWMIRAFSIGIGISTVRIVSGVFFVITRTVSFELLGLSFWIGWTLTLGAAELWIRYTRPAWRSVRNARWPPGTSDPHIFTRKE